MSVTTSPLAQRAAAPATVVVPPVAGYTFRPMTRDDAEAVYDMVCAAEAADQVAARSSAADVVEPFEVPWWDPATDSLLVVDAAGAVRGRALLAWRPGASRRVMVELFGAVHPDHRGRGVGTALLGWQRQRGRQLLAAAAEQDLPGALQIYVGDSQPGAVALAERHGFAATRWTTTWRASWPTRCRPRRTSNCSSSPGTSTWPTRRGWSARRASSRTSVPSRSTPTPGGDGSSSIRTLGSICRC